MTFAMAGDSNSSSWGTRRVVLSGSFNPLHDGHIKLLDTACRFNSGMVLFVLRAYSMLLLHVLSSDVAHAQVRISGRICRFINLCMLQLAGGWASML